MSYKINEIFYSLQGEGAWVGTPAIFIRFSGCNLSCPFCDTRHQTFAEWDLEYIYHEIMKYPAKRLILTGGEPTLQIDEMFCNFFLDKGYKIHMESNGTNAVKVGLGLDWLTISPKENWIQKEGEELKVIYIDQDLEQYFDSAFLYYYLQPCFIAEDPIQTEKNIQDTIKKCKEDPRWKLSLQLHRMLKIQ